MLGICNLIISKAPLRVTFFGGGTDFESYFKKKKTRTFGSAINKFSYIFLRELSQIDDCRFRITHLNKEQVQRYKDIQHPVFKAALDITNLKKSRLEINYFTDLLPYSGTGSSSAFAVSLLSALNFYKGRSISKQELANQAIYLERKYLKEPGGYQDQLTSAYGGLCLFEYSKSYIKKIKIKANIRMKQTINQNFVMVYTGVRRDGPELIRQQLVKDKNREAKLNAFTSQADESLKFLEKRDLVSFGALLNQAWLLKRKMPKVSSNALDKIYEKTLESGSLGGKLLGAGGGGFFLCLVPIEKKNIFRKKMSGFDVIDISVNDNGVETKFLNI